MPAPRRALGRRGFAACRRPPRGAWHPTPCRRLRSALHGPWRGLEGALPGVRQSTWGVPPRSPAFLHAKQGRRGAHATAWGPQARGIWGCHPLPGSRQQAAGGTPCREAAQRTRQLGAMVAPLGGAIDGARLSTAGSFLLLVCASFLILFFLFVHARARTGRKANTGAGLRAV